MRIPAKIRMYNQMLGKRENKEHPVYVEIEKDHIRLSIENAQDYFRFFREGNIEDLHIHLPLEAIKELSAEILDEEQNEQ